MNEHLCTYLTALNFHQVPNTECVYERKQNDITLRMLVYVDDVLIICTSLKLIAELKAELQASFRITDPGPAKYFLGVEIQYVPKLSGIFIHQNSYIRDVLASHGMLYSRPVSSPLDQGY